MSPDIFIGCVIIKNQQEKTVRQRKTEEPPSLFTIVTRQISAISAHFL
jgi:hypothetical protein